MRRSRGRSIPRQRPTGNAVAAALAAILLLIGAARADEVAGFYRATWAGLPAGDIRLSLGESEAGYRAEIAIETTGVAHLLTRFRAEATGEGRLADDGTAAAPQHYDALYDLRKRRGSRISLDFVARDGAVIAKRNAADTSGKPPLADAYRRNVVDPLSALASIRASLQHRRPQVGSRFTVPVYDGARRFDVAVETIAAGGADGLIRLALTLRPIAGFKGESSEDRDPDSAPRPVEVAFTDDARLQPVTMSVRIAFLPLVVRLDHVCPSFRTC